MCGHRRGELLWTGQGLCGGAGGVPEESLESQCPLGRGGPGRGARAVCSSPDEIRVKLLVPGAVQRCGDVETLPVQAKLDHLRASGHLFPLGKARSQSPGQHTDPRRGSGDQTLPSPSTLLQPGPEGTQELGEILTLTTRGSGWEFSSWSSSTCTGPSFTMLPPRKS